MINFKQNKFKYRKLAASVIRTEINLVIIRNWLSLDLVTLTRSHCRPDSSVVQSVCMVSLRSWVGMPLHLGQLSFLMEPKKLSSIKINKLSIQRIRKIAKQSWCFCFFVIVAAHPYIHTGFTFIYISCNHVHTHTHKRTHTQLEPPLPFIKGEGGDRVFGIFTKGSAFIFFP